MPYNLTPSLLKQRKSLSLLITSRGELVFGDRRSGREARRPVHPFSLFGAHECKTREPNSARLHNRVLHPGPSKWNSAVLSTPCPRPSFHVLLRLAGEPHTLGTFIDSGADISLIDEDLARQLEVGVVPLSHPVLASALDGHLVGTVTHHTTPIHMIMSGNHLETIQVHIIKSPNLPLILGYPW